MSTFAAAELTGQPTADQIVVGDKRSFALLVTRHHARMMRVAHVITGDA